jgi:hypothetical protein
MEVTLDSYSRRVIGRLPFFMLPVTVYVRFPVEFVTTREGGRWRRGCRL